MQDKDKINFRPAEPSDLAILLDLMAALYLHDESPFDRERAERATRELLRSPEHGGIWILEIEAAIAGYIVLAFSFSLEFGGREGIVDELFLQENYRHQGWGKQALQFAAEQCKVRGICAMHVDVNWINEPAEAIYKHLGFKGLERRRMTKWLADCPPVVPSS